MDVFRSTAQHLNRDNKIVHGQFDVTAGVVGAVKFKRLITVTRVSAGLFTLSLWSDSPAAQTVALKNMHLKKLAITQAKPGATTDGGWTWSVVDPATLATAGTVQIQAAQQSWAAADPTGTIRIELVMSPEAAS